MRRLRVLIAGGIVLLAPSAFAAPANTLQELFAEIDACAITSSVAAESELTIVFTLNRWGAEIGKPRISYSKLPDDLEARRAMFESVAKAIDRCLPLPITDALGGAIAGRPFSLRLLGRKKGTDT